MNELPVAEAKKDLMKVIDLHFRAMSPLLKFLRKALE